MAVLTQAQMQAYADQVASSKADQSGNWIKPGAKYLWEVLNILMYGGNGGNFYIAEMICRESVPTGEKDRNGKDYVPNAVGSTASYSVNLSDPKQKSAMGNVKKFVMDLFGEPESEVSSDVIFQTLAKTDEKGEVVAPSVCRGMLIRDEAWNKPQKTDPSKDFTHHRWTAVTQTDEEIAARKAELDKTNPLAVK